MSMEGDDSYLYTETGVDKIKIESHVSIKL